MYLVLFSEVSVGPYTTRSLSSCVIQSSWKELTDTCELTIPLNIKLRGENYLDNIKVGDPITVKLSSEGKDNLKTEFEGYVITKSDNSVGKLYCEDEMYTLRRKKVAGKFWSNAKIEEILNYVVKEHKVVVSEALNASITLGKFTIETQSTAARVLLKLRDFGIYCFFRGKVLYAGFANDHLFTKHTFDLGRNIVSNNLTREINLTADGVQIKATSLLSNGKNVTVFIPPEAPENSVMRTRNFGWLSDDPEEAKRLLTLFVSNEQKTTKEDGYSGSITSFGINKVNHGDEVRIINRRKRELGTYQVDKVTTTFGEIYFRRTIDIGARIS